MHPVPPDWALEGAVKPQEQEDTNPDKKTPAITKEGATKIDHESEFFENDKEQDINSNNGNENDMKKRKIVIVDNDGKKNADIGDKISLNSDKIALISDENISSSVEEKTNSDNIDEKNGESVAMDVVDDGDKEVVQEEKVEVEVEVGKEPSAAELER